MFDVIQTVARSLVSTAKGRRQLALENLALRHQLAVLQRQTKKPKLENSDRLLWMGLRRVWPEWKSSLYMVQPATVVKWHRLGFRAYWRRKSAILLSTRRSQNIEQQTLPTPGETLVVSMGWAGNAVGTEESSFEARFAACSI